MRIGIDAREIVGQATGVGRYLSGLLAEWVSSGAASRHKFVLYAHAPMPSAPPQCDTRVLPGTSGTWWQQVTLPAAARGDSLDVFFAPQYSAPVFLNVPTVVVIYDVSFAAHPEWFGTREGLRLRALARQSAAQARTVITISEFSRREIAEHLRVNAQDIHVIPPGIPVRAPGSSKTRSGESGRLLYVGSIFNRRHVPDLIRAFATVARSHPEATLDLVGANRTYPFEDIAAAVDRAELGSRITWHSYATDDVLTGLYGRAGAFAFPSEYEGLGLTPLEAMARGVPSVLLATAIARESCAGAALYVPKGDVAATTSALNQLLFDDPVRDRLLRHAPSVLAQYDWPRAATETLAVLEGAM